MAVGIRERPSRFQQPCQPIMGLSVRRLLGDDCSVGGDRSGLGRCSSIAANLRQAAGTAPARARRRSRALRAIGWGRGIVARRDDQDRQAADPFAVRDDRLETTVKVSQDRTGFRRRADRAADDCFHRTERPRGNDTDPLLLQVLPDQAWTGENIALLDSSQALPSPERRLIEVVGHAVRQGKPGQKLVVSGVDDERVGPPCQTGELQVHRLQRGPFLGQDLDPEPVRRYCFPQLTADDRADGEPILVRDAQGARLADDDDQDLVTRAALARRNRRGNAGRR